MAPTRNKLAEIPVAPLRRHIQRWLESQEYDDQDSFFGRVAQSPSRTLVEKIWPGGAWQRSYRNFYRIMHEAEFISFDLADRIICHVLGEPELWISDPELAEAYATVDLRSLDATRPTCESVAEDIAQNVTRLYSECGSTREVVRLTGISAGRIKAIIAAGELVCA